MNAYLADKAILGVTRRIWPTMARAYLPGIGLTVDGPGLLSSCFGEIFFLDIYKPVAPIAPGGRFVDLGAFLGMFSVYAAQNLKAGKIVVVEANPRTIPLLRRNIERLARKSAATIDLRHVAVAGHAGPIPFMIDSSRPANVACSAFLDKSNELGSGEFETVLVPTMPLADLLTEYTHFLKCDIEGAEYSAIEGDELHPDRIGQAVIEFHTPLTQPGFERIVTRVLANGYAVFTEDRQPLATWAAVRAHAEQSGRTAVVLALCDKALLGTPA